MIIRPFFLVTPSITKVLEATWHDIARILSAGPIRKKRGDSSAAESKDGQISSVPGTPAR
jgi:hypothetical protein